MTNFKLKVTCTILLATCSLLSIAQTAPNLGTAASFALFTSAGGFSNTGTTTIIGDIGYLTGSVTGNAMTLTGNTHYGDPEAAIASSDVANAYSQLTNTTLYPCGTTLTTPIGGVTLVPGVYCSTTATELTGNLTLDAEGDADAIFIIKIDGALSVNTPVDIILTNGASLKNVYWQVNGAFNLAAGAVFKGTLINAGAITLASGASISGRALSTAGLISLNNNNVSNTEAALPVSLVSFTVKSGENNSTLLTWATTAETNSDRFEIEHSTTGKTWNRIATVAANGKSQRLINYNFSHTMPAKGRNLYRLKMIDQDATFAYSRIRSIQMEVGSETVLYPNPSVDKLTLGVNDLSKIDRVQFNDLSGKLILDQKRSSLSTMSPEFNVANFAAGLYLVRVIRTDGSVEVLRIVKR